MFRKDWYTIFRLSNDPEFSDRQVLANSVEKSDQAVQCLPFRLHLSDTLFYGKITLFKF